MHPKLTLKQKEEKREGFMSWLTFIPDRVNEWKATIPREVATQLDWTVDSLTVLENYMLQTYTFETVYVPENKVAIDAMASYIGEVYFRHIPRAKWYIELNIRKDIDFGRPVVKVPIGAAFSPYPLVLSVLYQKTGLLLKELYVLRISNMREYSLLE